MPTYQYACTSCDERIEAVQRFTDEPLNECPACRGVLRKVFSAVGVVFKGSGFYKNDSRDSGKKATAPKETAATSSASSSSDGASSSSSSSSSDSASSSSSSSSSSDAKPSAPATKPAAAPAPAGKTA